MSREVIVYENFAKGELGRLGLAKAELHGPGFYSARNLVPTFDGKLVVRAGLSDITPAAIPAGTVWSFGTTGVPGKDGFIVIGATLYRFPLESLGGALTSVGAFAVTPTAPVPFCIDSNKVYFTVSGDKSYVYDPVASTLTALTGSPGGQAIAMYGVRLVVGNLAAHGPRIQYSDAANFNSWNALSFIDVGDGWQVTGLAPMRGDLLVAKQVGFYLISGTLDGSQTVRRLRSLPGPLYWHNLDVDSSDVAWFQPITVNVPAHFNGATAQILEYLNYGAGHNPASDSPPSATVKALLNGRAVFVDGINKLFALYSNGIWTWHTTTVAIPWVAPDSSLGRLHFCDGGSPAKVYSYDYNRDTPGDGTALASVGDGSTTPPTAYLHLPYHWDSKERELRVRSIVIDFTKWNTGSPVNNHIDVTVTAHNRWQANPSASAVQSWDEAGSVAATGGTDQRLVLGFGKVGTGGGFQVSLDNLKGVAPRSISVVVDVVESRER